jgi:hypothetical protein
MSDSAPEKSSKVAESHELESFPDVLGALVGKVVTIANPESYEDAPVGHRLTTGFYRAKIVEVKRDHIVLFTEFKHAAGHGDVEPTKQFIPLARIKRVSIMKSEKILHI